MKKLERALEIKLDRLKILFGFGSILLFFIFSSCTDEIIESPQQEISWQKYPENPGVAGYMNSKVLNGKLNVWTESLFIKSLELTNTAEANSFSTDPYPVSRKLIKMPIADNYYVFASQDKIILRSALTSINQSIERVIDLSSLDENFYQFSTIWYDKGQSMAINDYNQLLIPYTDKKSEPYFAIAQINSPKNEDSELKVEAVVIVKENLGLGSTAIRRVQTFLGYFFTTIGSFTYLIDRTGDISLVAEKALNIFEKSPDLYAFSPNFNSGLVELSKSTNQGKNWTVIGEIDAPDLVNLEYTTINNRIVGFTKGQLFEVEINSTSFQISELKSEGLGLADITSISLASGDLVFLTSQCNNFSSDCGAFYKPLKDFFERKKIE